MRGRRRESRYLLSSPCKGAFHTYEDVVVERTANGRVWVLSPVGAKRDDVFTLEFVDDGLARLMVRVENIEPVVVGEQLQHRLRLQIVEQES